MDKETQDLVLRWLSLGAPLVSVFALVVSFLSFRLSRKIQRELAADDVLVAGKPAHPALLHHEHNSCVVRCRIVNKSKRKACIITVRAFSTSAKEISAKEISVSWSDRIDHVGNPVEPSALIGIVDSTDLFVRQNQGEALQYVRLIIEHDFPNSPLIVTFDPLGDWQRANG